MTTKRNYVLVRTPKNLAEKGWVGYGWHRIDFRDAKTSTDLIDKFRIKGYEVGRSKNQIIRFFNLKEGDVVVVPVCRAIFIGIVEGRKREYQPKATDSQTTANRVPVKFLTEKGKSTPIKIFRSYLTTKLSSRLRIRQTIININEFSSEIDSLIERIRNEGHYSHERRYLQAKEAAKADFEEKLEKRLKEGKVYLEAGGLGLEELTKELLILEGYDVDILPKKGQPCGEDVDIEAVRTGIITQRLFIQVKNHNGTTGIHGIRQLYARKKRNDENPNIDENDIRYIFITTADNLSKDAQNEAEKSEIIVMTGEDFRKWLIEHIENLPEKSLQALGVVIVPQFEK